MSDTEIKKTSNAITSRIVGVQTALGGAVASAFGGNNIGVAQTHSSGEGGGVSSANSGQENSNISDNEANDTGDDGTLYAWNLKGVIDKSKKILKSKKPSKKEVTEGAKKAYSIGKKVDYTKKVYDIATDDSQADSLNVQKAKDATNSVMGLHPLNKVPGVNFFELDNGYVDQGIDSMGEYLRQFDRVKQRTRGPYDEN